MKCERPKGYGDGRLHSIKSILIFQDFHDIGELQVLVNVKMLNGRFQELPSLVEWDIEKRTGRVLRHQRFHCGTGSKRTI
jgi:hypothetical protein